MRISHRFSNGQQNWALSQLSERFELQEWLPGEGPLEIEIGFGKGRYLLEQAAAHPERRFLGIELVSKYFRLLDRRAQRRGLENLLRIRGEALYLLSTVLPRGIASVVHVYFPDPWPKNRHHKRRLFDPQTVDLVLGTLAPGGTLCFATDFLEYGELVHEILCGVPGFHVKRHPDPWPDGARTHYESKYIVEGRPILRLTANSDSAVDPERLHPSGERDIVVAWLGVDED